MKRAATAKSTAGGYVVTPTQLAIVLSPPRQAERTRRTTPVTSQSRAYRSRSRRERMSSSTTRISRIDATEATIEIFSGVTRSLLDRDDAAPEDADEECEGHLDDVVDRAQRVDGGVSVLALAHSDLHLEQAQPMPNHHHRRLDLGVVVRIIGREERDSAPVERLEARGRVGHLLPHEQADEGREEADACAARERRPVIAVAGREPRANDDVGFAAGERCEQLGDLAWVVLAVAVEAHCLVVAVLERVLEAGLDGAADAEVERQPHD